MDPLSRKCRCQGNNAECNFCFGSGVVSDEPETFSGPQTKKKASFATSPTRQKRSGMVTSRKPELFQSIKLHGRDSGSLPDKVIKILTSMASRSETNEDLSRIYQSIRSKVQHALKMNKSTFNKFLWELHHNTAAGPSLELAVFGINTVLKMGQVNARFTPEDVTALRLTQQRMTAKNPPRASSQQAYQNLPAQHLTVRKPGRGTKILDTLSPRKQREAIKRAEAKAPNPEYLLVLAPEGGFKDIDLEAIRGKVQGTDYKVIYVAGSKGAFRNFVNSFPAASAAHVSNPANESLLRQSEKTATLNLREDAPEPGPKSTYK